MAERLAGRALTGSEQPRGINDTGRFGPGTVPVFTVYATISIKSITSFLFQFLFHLHGQSLKIHKLFKFNPNFMGFFVD